MAVFETAGRGSIPRRGAERNVLGVCRISTRPCEGRRPGSTPGKDTGECGAGARRHGNRLQSGFKRVQLPPAPLIRPGQRRTPPCPYGGWRRVFRKWVLTDGRVNRRLAQWESTRLG